MPLAGERKVVLGTVRGVVPNGDNAPEPHVVLLPGKRSCRPVLVTMRCRNSVRRGDAM